MGKKDGEVALGGGLASRWGESGVLLRKLRRINQAPCKALSARYYLVKLCCLYHRKATSWSTEPRLLLLTPSLSFPLC